jgi:RNA polymerase subunit RPABC4/transcription elongation factor Spt4
MNCSKCGTLLKENAKFCPGCGSQVTQIQSNHGSCTNCGTTLISGAKFCPGCGKPIQQNHQIHVKNAIILLFQVQNSVHSAVHLQS